MIRPVVQSHRWLSEYHFLLLVFVFVLCLFYQEYLSYFGLIVNIKLHVFPDTVLVQIDVISVAENRTYIPLSTNFARLILISLHTEMFLFIFREGSHFILFEFPALCTCLEAVGSQYNINMLLKYAIYGGKMASPSMVFGWHHQLNGREFKKAPGVGDGQGSLVCCSPWGHKESDTTERLN